MAHELYLYARIYGKRTAGRDEQVCFYKIRRAAHGPVAGNSWRGDVRLTEGAYAKADKG